MAVRGEPIWSALLRRVHSPSPTCGWGINTSTLERLHLNSALAHHFSPWRGRPWRDIRLRQSIPLQWCWLTDTNAVHCQIINYMHASVIRCRHAPDLWDGCIDMKFKLQISCWFFILVFGCCYPAFKYLCWPHCKIYFEIPLTLRQNVIKLHM